MKKAWILILIMICILSSAGCGQFGTKKAVETELQNQLAQLRDSECRYSEQTCRFETGGIDEAAGTAIETDTCVRTPADAMMLVSAGDLIVSTAAVEFCVFFYSSCQMDASSCLGHTDWTSALTIPAQWNGCWAACAARPVDETQARLGALSNQIRMERLVQDALSDAGADAAMEEMRQLLLAQQDRAAVTELPAYYLENDYLPSRAREIREAEASGDTFIWITDLHFRSPDGKLYNALQSAQLIRYLQDRCGISKVFAGGDYCVGNTMTQAQAIEQMEFTKQYFSILETPPYYLIGNHEWNNPGCTDEQEINQFQKEDLYTLLLEDCASDYGAYSGRCDYYLDDANHRIRYFALHATRGGAIAKQTAIWMGEQLKTVPDGWTVVVLSHSAATATRESGMLKSFEWIGALLDAVNTRQTVTVLDTTFDYTDKDCIVALVMCGHIHRDVINYTASGIPIVCTTTDAYLKQNKNHPMVRAFNTITEQAFDVVQIDTAQRKIHCFRIGAGEDREVTY